MSDSSEPVRVLFLCTGNYYRSRFAEIVFNHLASVRGMNASADSRGLAPDPYRRNPGPISPRLERALSARGIPFGTNHRKPKEVRPEDFDAADPVIALCEREHRPMVNERFPEKADRIQYWKVEDVGITAPSVALDTIYEQVTALVDRIAAGEDAE